MPETAVYEYRFCPTAEYQVGPSRQVLTMQPVAIAHAVNHPTHGQFGLGILRPNQSHADAALGLGHRIHALCGRLGFLPSLSSFASDLICNDRFLRDCEYLAHCAVKPFPRRIPCHIWRWFHRSSVNRCSDGFQSFASRSARLSHCPILSAGATGEPQYSSKRSLGSCVAASIICAWID